MIHLFLYLYLFLFLSVAQADTVTYQLSQLLGRPAPQWPLVYGLLLTVLLATIRRLISRCFSSPDSQTTWSWAATSFLAVTLVSLPFASVFYLFLLGLIAVGIGWGFRKWQLRLNQLWGKQRTPWQHMMPAIVFALLLSLYLGIGAAATDLEHYEMRTAQTLQEGKKIEPSRMEKHSLVTSQRLFAMRSYSMAKASRFGLGNQLFRQPVPQGKSELLLIPNDAHQRLLFPVDSLYMRLGGLPRKDEAALSYFRRMAEEERLRMDSPTSFHSLPALDYYLCALLLEGNLDIFSKEFLRLYPRSLRNKKLPIYFAEALFLYTHTRTRPILVFHDSAVEANWQDYSTMKTGQTDSTIRQNLLRRSYGQTYWWWLSLIQILSCRRNIGFIYIL